MYGGSVRWRGIERLTNVPAIFQLLFFMSFFLLLRRGLSPLFPVSSSSGIAGLGFPSILEGPHRPPDLVILLLCKVNENCSAWKLFVETLHFPTLSVFVGRV